MDRNCKKQPRTYGLAGPFGKKPMPLYNLHHYEHKTSQARLDGIIDASYICLPYFDPAEADQIKAMKVNNNQSKPVLEETIRETLEGRLERGAWKVVISAFVPHTIPSRFGRRR